MIESDKPKQKKGLNEWVEYQTRFPNAFRNILNFLIFPGLFFWIIGQQFNDQVVVFQGFLLCYFLLIPLMMTNDAIVDSQNAFLAGNWELKDSQLSGTESPRHSLWRRMVPKMLWMGAIPAILSYLAFWIYIWVTGSQSIPLHPWANLFLAAFIGLIPTWIISHIWIKRYLAADISGFAIAMSRPKQSTPEPFGRYFFWEHALPWSIILAVLNILINLKGYTENFFAAIPYEITVANVAEGTAITLFVIALWMGGSAINQVRGDVRLGRVKEGKLIRTWLVIVLVLGIPILGYFLVTVFAIILGIINFSIIISTIIIIIVAVIAGLIGRYIGILLGITLETTGFFRKKPEQ